MLKIELEAMEGEIKKLKRNSFGGSNKLDRFLICGTAIDPLNNIKGKIEKKLYFYHN